MVKSNIKILLEEFHVKRPLIVNWLIAFGDDCFNGCLTIANNQLAFWLQGVPFLFGNGQLFIWL